MNNHKLKILKKFIILFSILIISLEYISPQNIFLEDNSNLEDLEIKFSNLLNSESLSSGKNCTISNCRHGFGTCVEDKCLCAYGLTTVKSDSYEQMYCNYKQKSKITAFFLEFFFPIGLGHAYAGKIYLAILKFSLVMIIMCGTCGELCCICFENQKAAICNLFLILFVLISWIVMIFFDLFAYAFGFYNDGNDIPLI